MTISLPSRMAKSAILCAVFLRELIVSSLAVARAVLGKKDRIAPAIIVVPLDLRTRAGVVTLANCVTLTPGTTSLHVSEDMSKLYVHVLDAPSAEAVIAGIKQSFETRIKEIEG